MRKQEDAGGRSHCFYLPLGQTKSRECVSRKSRRRKKKLWNIMYDLWEKRTLWYNLKKILICVFKLINLIYEVVQIKAYFFFFPFALLFTLSLISWVFLFLFENVCLDKLKAGKMTNVKTREVMTQIETKKFSIYYNVEDCCSRKNNTYNFLKLCLYYQKV